MARRTAAETRQLLLDTGVEMLHETGITPPVAHIRLQNVLRRAGLTTGAAYRIWAGQEDFQLDLAEEATLHDRDTHTPVGPTEDVIAHLLETAAPLEEVIRVATNAHIASYDRGREGDLAADRFLTVLALRAAALGYERLRRASLRRHENSIESFMELYAALMDLFGLRLREHYDLRQFAGIVAALGEGFAIQAIEGESVAVITIPDAEGVPREWTAFGRAVWACIAEFFERDVDAAPAPR